MSLWKKNRKSNESLDKKNTSVEKPYIESVTPRAVIPGGEIAIKGRGFIANGNSRPIVRFGSQPGSVLLSSFNRLLVRVPDGALSGELTVETGSGGAATLSIALGRVLADNLHPVTNPAVNERGSIYTTFSGSRGQKVPVSIFKIDTQRAVRPFVNDIMNPTGLAFDREGLLYISSRMEGTIYCISPDDQRSVYAEGMGVATGIAFDRHQNLYVGDRTGTIFKIGPDRQIFVFATLEPSVSAYHLAFGPADNLYVTGPTTSSFDQVYRISPEGIVSVFYRGLGRPQGMAFDADDNLYVAASLSGHRGIVQISASGTAELVVSGQNIVGLAFTPRRTMVLSTNNSVIELPIGIEGKPLL